VCDILLVHEPDTLSKGWSATSIPPAGSFSEPSLTSQICEKKDTNSPNEGYRKGARRAMTINFGSSSSGSSRMSSTERRPWFSSDTGLLFLLLFDRNTYRIWTMTWYEHVTGFASCLTHVDVGVGLRLPEQCYVAY
jgi:hypothetical protein